MSSTWNGSALRTNYTQEAGFSDSSSLARTLRYMNEIQKDISSGFNWPNLKFKMKKLVSANEQEIDLSPHIPSALTLAALAGGSLTTAVACTAKVTFVLFDEAGKEYGSIESEPGVASNSITPATTDLSLTVSAIPLYSGSTSVKPTTIHRRIYLKQGTGDYLLAKTIEDNTSVTTTITANPSSTIEPPENSMVDRMSSESPFVELNGRTLTEVKLEDILQFDPNLSTSGTPDCYARISPSKIFVYPKPSASFTLSYWVYRRPSRIFADTDRAIQLDPSLESVFEVGVNWKWYKYKQEGDWKFMFELYERMKSDAKQEKVKTNGQAMKVKVVC